MKFSYISYIAMYKSMLNKNTLGVKMCEANQKQHASRQVRPQVLISAAAKKLLYQNSLNNIYNIVYSIFFTIGFVTWPPFMLFKELKVFLIK